MQNIFDRDFYPTPRAVVEKMLEGIDVADKIVLEPSAGTGNIVDVLKDYGAREVLACEINDKWRDILQNKCTVIGSDFLKLTAEDVAGIDLLIQNPPFSDGINHILHAYGIAPEGTTIISLINDDNLEGYRTEPRMKLQEIIEQCGQTEYLGQCFDDAERRTNVRVSCIRLFKPATGEREFDGFFFDSEEEWEMQGEGLQSYNVVRDYVNRYGEAVKQFDSVTEIENRMNELIKPLNTSVTFGASARDRDGRAYKITRGRFKKTLQKEAWREIFRKMKIEKFCTSGMKKDIDRFIEQQEDFPFTMRNIYRMMEMIVGTHENLMKRVITDAFDEICSFSAENSTAGEKWKTNSDYMVNRKFIKPYVCDSSFSYRDNVSISWSSTDRLNDIQKALCFLTGRNYDSIPMLISAATNAKWGEWFEWGFFRCKGFKKGTMHFEFLDEDVWAKFNRTVAEIRGWNYVPRKSSNKQTKKRA